MFKLLKATAIVSIATIVTVLVGVIRAKFTAVTLGPSGVGIFSQATNFQQLIITISSLSMGLGIAKYVAKYHAEKDDDRVGQVISYAFLIQMAMSTAAVILIVLFSGQLSRFLFASSEYRYLLILISIASLFSVIASTYEATMFGFGNYRAFAKGRSFSGVLSLLPLILFVGLFQVKGGFVYLALNGFLVFAVYYLLFLKNVPPQIRKTSLSIKKLFPINDVMKHFGKDLFLYGGASFIGGILSMANVLLLRSLLIKYYGPEANGYYQVVFTLSMYYIALFTNGLWSYLYAKISAAKDMKSYSIELNHAIRFCIFGIVPILTGVFFFRDIIIHVVFSGRFMEARGLFPAQLFGDLFFIVMYIMGTSLMASTRLGAYTLFNFFYAALFVGIFFMIHAICGIRAITISYAAASAITVSAMLLYHVQMMKFRIYQRNIWLFASSIALAAIVFFVGDDSLLIYAGKATLVLFWLGVFSTVSEKRKVFLRVKERVKALKRRGNAA